MTTCVIIDYGSGNLRSAAKALEHSARTLRREIDVKISNNPSDLVAAERIVLPGVGAFKACKNGLNSIPELLETLQEQVVHKAKPFLGICVGMQLMASQGKEHETTDGLNWISGTVEAIKPDDSSLKIPHMGWNTIEFLSDHAIFQNFKSSQNQDHAYFVHSYQMNCLKSKECLARTDYGGPITAIIGRDNLIGTQFHPEKSQSFGLNFLANFLEWKP